MGFNILRSVSEFGNPDPSWVPDRVSIDLYLDPYTGEQYKDRKPLIKRQILIIDDALINHDHLKGHVFYVYKEV